MWDYIETGSAWEFAWKETSNVGIGSSSSRPCPSLWDWVTRLLSLLLKDLQEQIQKKPKWEWGTADLLSQVSKELVALTKQVSDLFEQIERTNRIAFQEKKNLDRPSVILLTIFDAFDHTCLSAIPNKSSKEDARRESWSKNCFHLVVSKRLESLLEYRRLMEGRRCFIPPSDFQTFIQPSANPAVIPVLW